AVGVAAGHGVLLVLVLVGGDGVVWLGLGPGAAEIVGVGLTERLSGDRVELGVLLRQGLSRGRQDLVLGRLRRTGWPVKLHCQCVAFRWRGLHGGVGRAR